MANEKTKKFWTKVLGTAFAIFAPHVSLVIIGNELDHLQNDAKFWKEDRNFWKGDRNFWKNWADVQSKLAEMYQNKWLKALEEQKECLKKLNELSNEKTNQKEES